MNELQREMCKDCGAEMLWIQRVDGEWEGFDTKTSQVLILRDPTGSEVNPRNLEVRRGHLLHATTCPKKKSG